MRKILVSYGYGAGWVSWASGSTEFKQWMMAQRVMNCLMMANGFKGVKKK